MRLIDADELLASLPTCYQDLDDGTLIEAVWKTIQDAEVVDAILIEWIEHWKFTEPKYWEVVNGNDEIGRMLDDWRKENESNISN